jgi:hypothetical protein
MFRRIVVAAVVVSSSLALAQAPSYRIKTRSVSELYADERSLIGQWCRYDFEGSRLSPDGWKKFDALTTMKSNPDYSSVYVVSRYQMVAPERPSMAAQVRYWVIGRFEPGIGYSVQPDTRDVVFRFAEKDGELQVIDLDPAQPNISKPAFEAWVKAQLATATTQPEKTLLQHVLDQLNPPPPKPKVEEGSSSSKGPK